MRAEYIKDVVVTDGNVIDARAYGDGFDDVVINAAIAAIGSDDITLVISPGTWAIGNNITVPANVTIDIPDGGVLQIAAGYTVAIQGSFNAGLYQVFDCANATAVVTFGKIFEVYPQWFGTNTAPGTTDMTDATNAAVWAAGVGGYIVINDHFLIDPHATSGTTVNGVTITHGFGGVMLLDNQTIEFVGNGRLTGKSNIVGDYGSLMQINGKDGVKVINPQLYGWTVAGPDNEFQHGLYITGGTNFRVEGGYIYDMRGDGIQLGGRADTTATVSSHGIIDGTIIDTFGRIGISSVGVSHITITGVIIDGQDVSPTGINFEPDATAYPNKNCIVTGTTIKNCENGIAFVSAYNDRMTVIGCYILAQLPIITNYESDVSVIGNSIYPYDSAGAVTTCLTFQGGGAAQLLTAKTVFSNNSVHFLTTGRMVNQTGHTTTATQVIIENNVFHLLTLSTTSTLMLADQSVFRNNTINIPATFVTTSLTANKLMILDGSKMVFEGNWFKSGAATAAYIAMGGSYSDPLITRQRNYYVNMDSGSAMVDKVKNFIEHTFNLNCVGLAASADADVTFDSSTTDIDHRFTGATGLNYQITVYGAGEAGNRNEFTARIKSASGTSVVVNVVRDAGTAGTQSATVYLLVSGYTITDYPPA